MTMLATRRDAYAAVLTLVVVSTLLSMVAYTGPLGNAVTLTAVLDAGAAGRTWILASMSVGLAVTLLAAGVIADRIGRRKVFELGAAFFVVANLLCAAAPSAGVFIAARIVAGVGATGMIATGLGLVASTPGSHKHQARTSTAWSASMGAGIAVGPVLAGLFDELDGWRWFYALLALGGAATWAGTRTLAPTTDAPKTPHPFDGVGFVLLTATLGAAVSAIVEVRNGLTGSTLALFVTAVVLAAAFGASQRFGPRQLIPLTVLAHRPFIAATIAGLGTGLGVIAVMAFAPSYLAGDLGLSTLQAGLLMTLWSGTSAVAALVLARHAARMTGTTQLILGLIGVALGMALLVAPESALGHTRFVVGLLVAGVASGLLNGGLARQAVASVPAAFAATGTAATNTARYIGAAIGVSAASITAATAGPDTGWTRIAVTGAALSLAAAAMVLTLERGTAPASREA